MIRLSPSLSSSAAFSIIPFSVETKKTWSLEDSMANLGFLVIILYISYFLVIHLSVIGESLIDKFSIIILLTMFGLWQFSIFRIEPDADWTNVPKTWHCPPALVFPGTSEWVLSKGIIVLPLRWAIMASLLSTITSP